MTPLAERLAAFQALRHAYTLEDLYRDYGYGGAVPDQRPSEWKALLDAVRELAPRTVVEIGSNTGGTLYYWLAQAERGATVVTVDIDHSRLHPDHAAWARPDTALVRITRSSTAPETLRALSVLAPLDFVFIDGGHATAEVLADVEAYAPISQAIALHDTCCRLPDWDVRRAWQTLVASPAWDAVEFAEDPERVWDGIAPGAHGYGIGLAVRRVRL